MPTETKPPRKRPPSPQNWKRFDAWSSASTGHQKHRAAYAGSVSWRDTRSLKLERQLQIGDCLREEDHANSAQTLAFDGICALQSVHEGNLEDEKSPAEDILKDKSVEGPGEWKWVTDAEAKRAHMGVKDIRSFMGVSKRKAGDELVRAEKKKTTPSHHVNRLDTHRDGHRNTDRYSDSRSGPLIETAPKILPSTLPPSIKPSLDDQMNSASSAISISTSEHVPKIFAGITVFLNGSTLPLISDHKLKQLLVKHGAQISIFMARKTVSHMIVGQPNTGSEAAHGAGGGLSARKLQQEIARGGWKGVKIISVEWALESINAGKRLAEFRFAVLNVAQKGQKSVAGMLGFQ
ncbi:hypothetical protein N7478_002654 [Penicillium angulare]|uniref:uncharacterized protein n=1 Tax=Penicillium angulare TaxID=116970 RepID=UPI002540550F|nr:uncharacterized protein N7478_002654 [Penicillium angulare]KAJ5286968.1 hypothetical protein N7478_002654 [Penicillium angulare]